MKLKSRDVKVPTLLFYRLCFLPDVLLQSNDGFVSRPYILFYISQIIIGMYFTCYHQPNVSDCRNGSLRFKEDSEFILLQRLAGIDPSCNASGLGRQTRVSLRGQVL